MPNIITLILFLVFSVAGCTSKPLLDIDREYFPVSEAGEDVTMEQAKNAIIAGAKQKGWSPRVVAPGIIDANIRVRKHEAEVRITYTEEYYSIRYRDSYNLDYKNGKIHRNYNNWILYLSGSIQREFNVRSQRF